VKVFCKKWASEGSRKAAQKLNPLALPSVLVKALDVIDNPWSMAVDRADKSGLLLAMLS